MRGPCLCGDPECRSCGSGPWTCSACGAHPDECADPAACAAKVIAADEAFARSVIDMEKAAEEYWRTAFMIPADMIGEPSAANYSAYSAALDNFHRGG